MPIDPAILADIDHLKDMQPSEQTALAERMDLLRFESGQIIFGHGDPGHALYIVRSGEVEIYLKNDKGEKIVLEVSKPGDVFGEISLLDDGPRTAWVSAISKCEALRLDREHFEDYVRLYPPAALHLLSVAARRLRKSDDFIRRTVSRNANDVAKEQRNIPALVADAVSSWSGSIPSVFIHAAAFTLYALVNLGIFRMLKPFDPYPFSLLSDLLGIEAIMLTLFVLASQNRQKSKDSIRSDVEFETNVNAELKIAYLHEKVDRLSEDTYRVLTATQKVLALVDKSE
jgi:CRP/FNR family transcriptional regulator, cyclic AMP receptor protein